jgi:hypothetical protein
VARGGDYGHIAVATRALARIDVGAELNGAAELLEGDVVWTDSVVMAAGPTFAAWRLPGSGGLFDLVPPEC